MTRDLKLYVKDILDNMQRAESFVGGMKYGDFAKDIKTAYAVVRCLEIIGEAVKNITQPVRKAYPAVPWKAMAGMRDKVIHFYFGVKFKTVWTTVKKDIPALRPFIEQIKDNMDKK